MEHPLRWHRRTFSGGEAWLICGLLALLTGCSSVPGERYTVDTLPATLVAARRENAQTVDLSRLASAAVNSELIDRRDVIEVTIATGLSEKESYSQPVRVRDDGIADIPVIGPVHLAGLELAEAEAAIFAAAVQGQKYRNPYVTVTMKHQRVNKVTVVGAVKEPGVYEIPRGQSDLLAALVEAGGLADNAGTMVEIRNPIRDVQPPDPVASAAPDGVGPVGYSAPGLATAANVAAPRHSVRVDLVSAAKSGTGGYVVDDGAVVMVERRDPEPVHVIGLVNKPDRYEFPIGEDLRVTHAVALAGGLSSPVANKIFVIRKKPDSAQTAIVELKLSDAKRSDKHDLLLAPGDVVSVEQTPLTVFIDTMRIINFGFGASLPLTAL
jgi:polysaccharide export outer membrane protein